MLVRTKKLGLVASMLVFTGLLLASPSAAQRARGTMAFECLPPEVLKLNLKGFPNNETLILSILWGGSTIESIENKETLSEQGGRWCKAPDHCEPLKSTIRFTKFNLNKTATGTYTIEFNDGRKQSGAFSVVRSKQPNFRCE